MEIHSHQLPGPSLGAGGNIQLTYCFSLHLLSCKVYSWPSCLDPCQRPMLHRPILSRLSYIVFPQWCMKAPMYRCNLQPCPTLGMPYFGMPMDPVYVICYHFMPLSVLKRHPNHYPAVQPACPLCPQTTPLWTPTCSFT